MAGPAKPQVAAAPYGKGALITIQSNLPYRSLNLIALDWSRSAGFTTPRGRLSIGIHSNRFYVTSSSSSFSGTLHFRLILLGQGGDEDSAPSDEFSVTVDKSAADPPTPSSPRLVLSGVRQGIQVSLEGLAQPSAGPDLQYAELSWRSPPTLLTQRLYQIKTAGFTTRLNSDGNVDYDPFRTLSIWQRTKSGSDPWGAWESGAWTYANVRTDDFNKAILWAQAQEVSLVGEGRGYETDGSNWKRQYGATGNPWTSLRSAVAGGFKYEPSGFSPTSLSQLNRTAASLVFISRYGNHVYNVVLAADESTWWYDGRTVLSGSTQRWSSRNASLPDEVLLQQAAGDLRPGRTGLLRNDAVRLVTHAQMGSEAPSGMLSNRRAVLAVSENATWGPTQAVDSAGYRIDGLTDGESYEVAAAARTWVAGPFTRATGTAGGSASAPVVAPPVPAIGYDNIVIPIVVDAGRFVSEVRVTAGGSGYTSPPDVVIEPGLDSRSGERVVQGRPAKATASVSGGVVTAISVLDGGTGYGTFTPAVELVGGGGSGAEAQAVIGVHDPITKMNIDYRPSHIFGSPQEDWRPMAENVLAEVWEQDGFPQGYFVDLRCASRRRIPKGSSPPPPA